MFKILPYRQGSSSAKTLAEALNGRVLRLTNSRYRYRPDRDVVINWGCTDRTNPHLVHAVNGTGIREVSNKLRFFTNMSEGGRPDWLPEFWTDSLDIPVEAFPVVCRTVLAGHSGEGIVIANNPSELVPAALYTKYIRKTDEYRIHVGNLPESDDYMTVISVQQKRRRTDHENPNWQVRNLANGFIYARENVDPPEGVIRAAFECFARTSLDFGAVDVIWNERRQQAYVLEVNSAPGISGTTVEDYVQYFRALYPHQP